MPSKPSILTTILSTIKNSKQPRTPGHNIYSTNKLQLPQHMVDSAFSSSSNTDSKWECELERIHEYGQQLSNDWYQELEQLTVVVNRVTSPFHNANRKSLHRAQLFIESYREELKKQGYGKKTYQEKTQCMFDRFSEQADLKQCTMGICELEQGLLLYRQTMDHQLSLLWNTCEVGQSLDTWKEYLQQYHYESNQMETKFKALLESSSPNPDEYTCAVCLSIFTDPITLQPCLHTFCKDCIQHIYCTCQLSHCDSSCHDAVKQPSNIYDHDHNGDDHSNNTIRQKYSNKIKKLSQRLSPTYKPRYRSVIPPKTPSSSFSSSSGRHNYLRSPLKLFTKCTSSTTNPRPTTCTAAPQLPFSRPSSISHPTTIATTEEADVDERDSALEIALPTQPPHLPTPPPPPTTTTTTTTTAAAAAAISNTLHINAGSVTLQCTCPLSWSVPPAAQCPLCRHPFGPEDCTQAIGLDNLVHFYFPRNDKVRQRYNTRQRQLKRRSFFASVIRKCLPSSLVPVPLPSRRQPPNTTFPPLSPSPPPASVPMMMMI